VEARAAIADIATNYNIMVIRLYNNYCRSGRRQYLIKKNVGIDMINMILDS